MRERQRTRSFICDAGLAGTWCGMSNTELVGGASSSASFWRCLLHRKALWVSVSLFGDGGLASCFQT